MMTFARNLTTGGLLMVCMGTPAWADFETGMVAFQQRDFVAALKEFRPLAYQGDSRAQLFLGFMYHHGEGVSQDDEEARRWYLKAAEQGSAEAQFNLGSLYDDRDEEGVVNYPQAASWYHRAAEQGHSLAQTKLGTMYYYGVGLPKDYVKAYLWYSLAAQRGETKASELRAHITEKMTPAQITEAHKLAREWKPKK